jgi:hypothetical protein
MKVGTVILAAAFCLGPLDADAQISERFVAVGDIGYARTWDDEGLLGAGASLTGGFGVRLTPRLIVQAIVDRVGYHRDEDWLTFDGRVIFAGVEAAFSSSERKVRGFWSIGGGVFNDDGTAIRKSPLDPRLPQPGPRQDPPVDRAFTLAAMTASGGIEVPVSTHASVRAGVRFHGLLDTGDDAAPHSIIQPTIGIGWRW